MPPKDDNREEREARIDALVAKHRASRGRVKSGHHASHARVIFHGKASHQSVPPEPGPEPAPHVHDEAERFTRIEMLMEEYRIKHADLEAYVSAVRERALGPLAPVRSGLERARAHRRKRR